MTSGRSRMLAVRRPAEDEGMTSRTASRRTVGLAFFLALWSAGFACVHMAWALGWRAGVPSDAAPIAERPVFLAYDVLAGLLMYAATVACVWYATGRTTPALRRITVACAVLALLRGAPALAHDLATGTLSGAGFGADVWFVVAGIAGLLLWRTTRPASPGGSPAPGRRPLAVDAG